MTPQLADFASFPCQNLGSHRRELLQGSQQPHPVCAAPVAGCRAQQPVILGWRVRPDIWMMRTHTHTHRHKHRHACTHARTRTQARKLTHTYTHTRTLVHTHSYAHAYTRAHARTPVVLQGCLREAGAFKKWRCIACGWRRLSSVLGCFALIRWCSSECVHGCRLGSGVSQLLHTPSLLCPSVG